MYGDRGQVESKGKAYRKSKRRTSRPVNFYSAYSGGASSRSARISWTTCRRFSTSTRSPTTSIVEIELLGERGGALFASDPVCEMTLDDVVTDSDRASWCVPVHITWRCSFVHRSGEDDIAVFEYASMSSSPIPANPAISVSEGMSTGT